LKREYPVIPGVLPSAKATPKLPWTLANLNWVDFRETDLDPLKQLIWGISGQRPNGQFQALPSNNPPLSPESSDVQGLVPRREKATIEIRLVGKNINEFSDEERDKFLDGLSQFLGLGDVRLTRATN